MAQFHLRTCIKHGTKRQKETIHLRLLNVHPKLISYVILITYIQFITILFVLDISFRLLVNKQTLQTSTLTSYYSLIDLAMLTMESTKARVVVFIERGKSLKTRYR